MNYSKQRRLIMDILKECSAHPTADWIYSRARSVMPNIGIATVYRNLNSLVELGELKRIPCSDGVDRFDIFSDEHYHMHCRKCGRLVDLPHVGEEALNHLKDVIGETFGIEDQDFTITSTLVSGICSDCRRGENDNNFTEVKK